MKIIQTIQNILKNLRSLTPIAGEGVNIERTPNGTVFTCTAQPVGGNAASKTGMFDIVDASDSNGPRIRVIDTSPAAELDSDGIPLHAGIPHVNGVAFPIMDRFTQRLTEPRAYYIYLHFDTSRIVPQEEDAAGTADPESEVPEPDPPAFEIVCETIQRRSSFSNLYYLLGRARCEKASGKLTLAGITLDREPGPAFLTWYGPDIGVAEDNPLEETP